MYPSPRSNLASVSTKPACLDEALAEITALIVVFRDPFVPHVHHEDQETSQTFEVFNGIMRIAIVVLINLRNLAG